MKTLLLIRHAKAQRSEAGVSDHDRILDERGRRDAPEMGRRLNQRGIRPDLVISSTALRAASTARLIARELGLPAEAVVEDSRLYASSVAKMLYLIQELDDGIDGVAMVGHNPEMTELAQHYSSGIPDMATCAIAQLEFDMERWTDIVAAVPSRAVFDTPRRGHD